MKSYQHGATLIVVLILLVIMTVIGTLAMRNSLTALNIATNSQAQQLLLQNSDAAIFNVEDPKLLVRNLSYDGIFGFVKSDANRGKELVFCYRGDQASFFDFSKASLMMWNSPNTSPTNNSFGVDGYCKIGDTNFFTSGRKAVMTQVAVKVFVDTSTVESPFEYIQQGTDTEAAKIDKSEKIMVIATSIMPALSSASTSAINNCFSSRMNQVAVPAGVTPASGANKSVAECLQELNVPVNTQITEYNLTQAFSRIV